MNDRKVLIRRFIAYLVDWYVGALVIGFPITLFSQKLFGKPTVLNLLKFCLTFFKSTIKLHMYFLAILGKYNIFEKEQ